LAKSFVGEIDARQLLEGSIEDAVEQLLADHEEEDRRGYVERLKKLQLTKARYFRGLTKAWVEDWNLPMILWTKLRDLPEAEVKQPRPTEEQQEEQRREERFSVASGDMELLQEQPAPLHSVSEFSTQARVSNFRLDYLKIVPPRMATRDVRGPIRARLQNDNFRWINAVFNYRGFRLPQCLGQQMRPHVKEDPTIVRHNLSTCPNFFVAKRKDSVCRWQLPFPTTISRGI
jgi:hypothetical protein